MDMEYAEPVWEAMEEEGEEMEEIKEVEEMDASTV